MSALGALCDQIAERITPDELAREIGAEKGTGPKYHCPRPHLHENGDSHPSCEIKLKDGRCDVYCHCGLRGSPVTVLAEILGCEMVDAARPRQL